MVNNQLHRWRKLLLGCSFFLIAWLLPYLTNEHSSGVGAFYFSKFYRFSQRTTAIFFDRIPISVGDLCYALVILSFFYASIKYFRNPRLLFSHWKLWVFWLGLLFLVFQLRWGLNYQRVATFPIQKEFQEFNSDALIRTVAQLIDQTNCLHQELSPHPDSIAHIPYSKKELQKIIENASYFKSFQTPVKLKHSEWSLALSYMGYSGYLNPWTLEAQVNRKIPKMSYVITAAHELQHQLGIARENEANFGAFLATSSHPDPWIQLAANSFALRYCLSALWRNMPEEAKTLQKKIHPGILAGYREQADFWRRYENPLEHLFKWSYDHFLKAQGQALGIQSYGAVVQLLIQHFENQETTLENTKKILSLE